MAEKRKLKRGIFGVKKRSSDQLKPFGKYSVPYNSESDSSDCDYIPDGTEEPVKKKARPSLPPVSSSCKNRHGKGTPQGDENDLKFMVSDEKPTSKWGSMPTEILVKIFTQAVIAPKGIQHLLSFGQVCQQWYYASCHPSLWRKVDLSFMSEYKKANDKSLITLVKKRGDNISEIILAGWSKLTDKGLMAIAKNCKNLQGINISKCVKNSAKKKNITAQGIIALSKSCNLKMVDVSWIQIDSSFKGSIQCLINKQGALLEGLNLCGCLVRSSTLQCIQTICPNLRILDISNTSVYQLNIEKLQNGCPKLEELYMANLDLDFKTSHTKQQGTADGFRHLTALSVNTVSLTDKILLRLLKNSNSLKILDLRQCTSVTITGIEGLQAYSVKRLFLSKACSGMSFESILSKWCDSLVELDLSWTSQLSPSCFQDDQLERISRLNLKLNKLSTLDLSGTAITDEGLRFILSFCPNLNTLDLTSCKALSRGMKHKHDRESIKKLRASKNRLR